MKTEQYFLSNADLENINDGNSVDIITKDNRHIVLLLDNDI